MKLLEFALSAIVLPAVTLTASATDGFTIKGTIPSTPDSVKVSVVNIEGEKGKSIADGYVKDGQFTIEGSVKAPTMCELRFSTRDKKGNYRSQASPKMMIENCGDITVAISLPLDSLRNEYQPELFTKVNAGVAQKQYEEYFAATGEAELKSRKLGYLGAKQYFASNGNEDTVAKYDALKKQAADLHFQKRMEFVKAHPDYYISAFDVYKELVNIFTHNAAALDEMAQTVKACPDTARQAGIDRRLDWSKKYCMEMQYPDFEMTAPDGTVKSLSAAMTPGKYTFVDFWASWCGPCRAAIPHVRELHKKYGDRLNVFSVSGDEDSDKWRKAMDEEKMEWSQFHLAGEQMEKAAMAYFLQTIPRLIVIDDKGRIVCSTNKPADVTQVLRRHLGE